MGSHGRLFRRLLPGTAIRISNQSKSDPSGFDVFQLPDGLRRGLVNIGFTDPRPIQAAVLSAALEGSDVLGLAQTGTGKTAAFALPILSRMMERSRVGPRALIVAPTRELASQIHAELVLLGKYTRVTATKVFGGVPQGPQERALRKLPDVVVACPGRLLDLVDQRAVSLADVEVLVLDEADHMFDMGFLPAVRRIVAKLPKRRQNLLFSATMPTELRKLADGILDRPKVAELAHSQPAATIAHAIYPVAEGKKLSLVERLLDKTADGNVIVFTRTKHRAKRLAKQLDKIGFDAVALQGNMSQGQRERAMSGFREGAFDILVATDIAARGIDVAGVGLVVNYDVPNTPDAYTHRIGRTGRSECKGQACTLVTRDDLEAIRAIERRIGQKIDVVREQGFEMEPPRPAGSAPPQVGRGGGGQRGNGSGGQRGNGSGGRSGSSSPGRSSSGRPSRGGSSSTGTSSRSGSSSRGGNSSRGGASSGTSSRGGSSRGGRGGSGRS